MCWYYIRSWEGWSTSSLSPLPHRLQPLGLHHFRTHEPPSESHSIALPPPSPPRGAHHLACLRPPERSNPRKVIIWFFCLFALVRPFPEFEWAETLSASASDPTTSSNSSGRARNAVNHLSEHWRRVYCDVREYFTIGSSCTRGTRLRRSWAASTPRLEVIFSPSKESATETRR